MNLSVGTAKRKAVVNADAAQLDQVEALVRQGRFRTVSDFVRRAMAEKLAQLDRERLAEEVTRYCREEASAAEAPELVAWQAFDLRPSPKRRRAKG